MRKKRVLPLIVGVLTMVIFGCVTNRVNLSDEGLVSVEKQDGEKIKILWTDIYQKDGQTWAYGVLEQRGYHPSAIKTHVDIQVLSKEGSVYYETFSEDVYVPPLRARKGPNWIRFRTPLAGKISEGVKISMAVHSGIHERR
jgi:hypothetical protein